LPPRSDDATEDPTIDACVDGEAGMAPGVPPEAATVPTERAGDGAAAAAELSVSMVRCGRLALPRLVVAILAISLV